MFGYTLLYLILCNFEEFIPHITKFTRSFAKIDYLEKDRRVVDQVTTNDNEWYNSDNEWQRVVQRMTTNDNEWQRVTTSYTTSDSEWQQMTMRDSEWQKWYNEWKRLSTLQGMDDCHPFNDKNRYTTASRDGWLQLEWLNK